MDADISFGSWIKKRRKMLDLTQKGLAERVCCSQATIEKIEADQRRPSRQLAELLAKALEIPPSDRAAFMKIARGSSSDDLTAISPIAHQRRSTNLPIPATPLVGRQSELAEITHILENEDCRILTLVGPGGIGKSRLAIQAAENQQDYWHDGVCFIAFTSIHKIDLISQAIAETLNLKITGSAPTDQQLISWLENKELLLILDNFEHLIAGVDTIYSLLNQACGVKLLVTSREPLGIPGEWLFDVQGLPIPREITPDIVHNSAVSLFLQSARRAKTGFSTSEADWPAIVRICRLVEGMPLGIELAAAWVRTLTVQEIQDEVERSLDFLSASLRGLPERHRSLKALFEHSWQLLSSDEQTVLKQLAVFQGGFSRQAAAQITGANLTILAALVAKSLVWRVEDGRFDLHEVIRQYAMNYLADDPLQPVVLDRHADYYLDLLAVREPDLKSTHQQIAIHELKREISNIRSAMSWAVQRGKFSSIGKALRSYALLSDLGGWLAQGVSQLEGVVQALQASQTDPELQRVLAMALTQQGDLLFRQGEFQLALARLEYSLTISRQLREPDLLCAPLIFSGVITQLIGDPERGKTLTLEGLTCAQSAGDSWFEAYAILNLGYIEGLRGNYTECYDQMLSGINLWRSLGDARYTALGLNYISTYAITLGLHSQAVEFLQESLALCVQVGDRWGMATAYRNLGLATLALGDPNEAKILIQKSLELFTDLTTGWDIARSLVFLGRASQASGNSTEAGEAYLKAIDHSVEADSLPITMEALLGLGHLCADAGDLYLAMLCYLWVSHDPVATHETRDEAMQGMDAISFRLNTEQIDHAREQAANLPLRALVEMVTGGLSDQLS